MRTRLETLRELRDAFLRDTIIFEIELERLTAMKIISKEGSAGLDQAILQAKGRLDAALDHLVRADRKIKEEKDP